MFKKLLNPLGLEVWLVVVLFIQEFKDLHCMLHHPAAAQQVIIWYVVLIIPDGIIECMVWGIYKTLEHVSTLLI